MGALRVGAVVKFGAPFTHPIMHNQPETLCIMHYAKYIHFPCERTWFPAEVDAL
jgi:hypothetical protein